MIGEIKDTVPADDIDADVEKDELEDHEDTALAITLAVSPAAATVLSEDAVSDEDNVGDISVEINVEELVAKLEATDDDDVTRQRDIRKRLDELEEDRKSSEELDSTYNFNLDDEL